MLICSSRYFLNAFRLFDCTSAFVIARIMSFMMVFAYTASLSCLLLPSSLFSPIIVVISSDISTDSAMIDSG